MICPKCSFPVTEQPIWKYREDKTFKIVGRERYCINRECDYQEDL